MTKNFKELYTLLDGAQHKKDIIGWQTLPEFNNSSKNKNFDATVYKQGNRIVISFAGSKQSNDFRNDLIIFGNSNKIPSQYGDAEHLYKLVKNKYPNAQIESVGYSLGGTISNLLAHRIGIQSTALAPIGSKHIAKAYPKYFKYGDNNITTYGRKADCFFNNNLQNGHQSGNIVIIPDLPKGIYFDIAPQHMLHNYNPDKPAKPFKPQLPIHGGNFAGYSVPIKERLHIFTPEEIGKMSTDEFAKNEAVIMQQMKANLIQNPPPKIDYSNYKNPISAKKEIFTREDIAKMSTKEYAQNEKTIMAQMRDIGIPYKNEIPQNATHSQHNKSSSVNSSTDGKWVTINGNHVFIEK